MMNAPTRLLILLIPPLCCGTFDGQESSKAPLVTLDMAHRLAASTLTAAARHLPGMRFDAEKTLHKRQFYWFEVTAHTPKDVSPLLGYFAVNKMNGDVWDPVACTRLDSPFVRSFQMKLRTPDTTAHDAPCEP